MVQRLTLADSLSLGDLHTYLQRAGRVEDGSVRLIAGSGILAVYTAILYPRGILDESPTVLGLRTFALSRPRTSTWSCRCGRSSSASCGHAPSSATTTSRARDDAQPPEVNTVTWAGISPPQGRLARARRDGCRDPRVRGPRGHRRGRHRDPRGHRRAARAARALRGLGSRRRQASSTCPRARRSRAFSLGFLGDDPVRLFETGPWTRLTSRRGHVLVRRQSVDPQGVARPRSQPTPTQCGPPRGAAQARAIARPAARPEKRHPPRNVPSSAR